MITCTKHPGRKYDSGTDLAIHLVAAHEGSESDAAFVILVEALSRRGQQ